MREAVRRPSRRFGLERSRWRLADLGVAVPWLRGRPRGSAHRLLRRLGVRYKRGRAYLHSPDPAYDRKLAAVTAAQALARANPGAVALLYLDEFTYRRRPTVARGWAPAGADAPRAARGLARNHTRRVVACLDAATGRVVAWQRERCDRGTLARFDRAVAAAYPGAVAVFVAQDNWSVHFHPEVLAALAGTAIRPLPLPTYAPWTNPVADLWRGLFADVLHHHPFGDDWAALQAAVQAWLDRWAAPSPDPLHLVGLVGLCPDQQRNRHHGAMNYGAADRAMTRCQPASAGFRGSARGFEPRAPPARRPVRRGAPRLGRCRPGALP